MTMIPDYLADDQEEHCRRAAQAVLEKMGKLTTKKGIEQFSKSWVYELIQNARDNANSLFKGENVDILIELSNSFLSFKHSHGYFNKTNIKGLVEAYSAGKSQERNRPETANPPIGRFGTGFMTTHLLSKKVKVECLFELEDKTICATQFTINREANDEENLWPLIAETRNQFNKGVRESKKYSKQEIDFSELHTSFTYLISENNLKGQEAVKEGITALDFSLPYSLVFLDNVAKVTIKNNGNEIFFEKKEPVLKTAKQKKQFHKTKKTIL